MQDWIGSRQGTSVCIAFLLSFSVIFAFQDLRLLPFDESIILVGALRTLNGDFIHRDFYSVYGPASYYILGSIYAVSDNHFLAGRIYGIGCMAAIVAAVFALLVDRTRPAVSIGFSAITAGWMIALPYYLYPSFPALFCFLIGSWLLLRSVASGRRGGFILAGCSAGAASLFRYDAGFFELIAHFTAIAIIFRLGIAQTRSLRSFVLALISYSIGAALIFLPFGVFYLLSAPLSDFWVQIVDYGSHYYKRMRGLPIPVIFAIRHPSNLGIHLPFAAVIFGCIEFLRWRRDRAGPGSRPDGDAAFLIVMTLLAAIMILKGLVRPSPVHMITAIVPASLVLALATDRAISRAGMLRASVPLLVALLPMIFALQSQFNRLSHPRDWLLLARPFATLPQECPTRSGTFPAVVQRQYAIIGDYLRHNSKPDERIFVGLDRHDKILVNSIVLYFLADRQPGTRWHQMDPGLQTRADIQKQMIDDLARNHVRWAVRDASFSGVNEPNDSSISSGVHLLDRYLSSHYRPVAQSGSVQLWLLRGEPAPPPSGKACAPEPI